LASVIGTFALFLALAVAVYGAVASFVGARSRNALMVESARTTAWSLTALVLIANVTMLVAILANDFSLHYVAENSSRATPTFFKVLALWSADQGSLLLWNLVLSGYLLAVAIRFRRRRPETFPWALGVMYVVSGFYLLLVTVATHPFGTLARAPRDGQGPLPLLQNHPLMAAHPPMLYLGFIGMTVPFAFAMSALITGRLSDQWIRITRRWTMFAWVCLTAGLFLGSLWSYSVLGWGGYWAWDPVENIALLPWLASTAFLHSVMVQERRGMLKVWNLSLIVATFGLTVFGTFLTRGSILSSVHSFAQSAVGPMYLAFLLIVLCAGFGLIAARSKQLSGESRIDRLVSREGVFLGNNILLAALTFTVLIGTVFPLLNEALTGTKVIVGGPYFDRTAAPVMLLLLFLMGIGPLLPWRVGSGRYLLQRLKWPVWAGALTIAGLVVTGVRHWAAIAAFGLAAFVGVATVVEMVRGVRAHRRAYGGGVARSAFGAVARNRRLYGGLVAHLGLVIVIVAITWSSTYSTQKEVTLARGQSTSFAGYELRYTGSTFRNDPNRVVFISTLQIIKNGRTIGVLIPSLNFYPSSQDPIGTPSISKGTPFNGFHDLYASLQTLAKKGTSATFRLFSNPGVMWLWVGGGVIVLGGIIALWPVRRRPPSSRPDVPAEASSEEPEERVEAEVTA
jgi:cytochrome c-type biogenesis protein CcmF